MQHCKNIHRFFEEIKPANSKHLKKYLGYLNDSAVNLMAK